METAERLDLRPEAKIVLDRMGEEPAARLEAVKLETRGLNLYYGTFRALKDINLAIKALCITAIIGPSGCGKSSLLRVFNRMNDLIPSARLEGQAFLDGYPLYEPDVDVVELRKRVGMVFQKPNPFPPSVYDNVAFGPRM